MQYCPQRGDSGQLSLQAPDALDRYDVALASEADKVPGIEGDNVASGKASLVAR